MQNIKNTGYIEVKRGSLQISGTAGPTKVTLCMWLDQSWTNIFIENVKLHSNDLDGFKMKNNNKKLVTCNVCNTLWAFENKCHDKWP